MRITAHSLMLQCEKQIRCRMGGLPPREVPCYSLKHA